MRALGNEKLPMNVKVGLGFGGLQGAGDVALAGEHHSGRARSNRGGIHERKSEVLEDGIDRKAARFALFWSGGNCRVDIGEQDVARQHRVGKAAANADCKQKEPRAP